MDQQREKRTLKVDAAEARRVGEMSIWGGVWPTKSTSLVKVVSDKARAFVRPTQNYVLILIEPLQE
jgi:hypothetical protein